MNASSNTLRPLTRRIARFSLALLFLGMFAVPMHAQLNTGQAKGLGENTHSWKPQNGLYLVLDKNIEIAALREAGREEIVLVNDYKYLEEKTGDAPEYMILRRQPDVPLILAASPVAGKDKDGKPMLNLSLADEHVETLRSFTEANMGQTVAIVINSEVISAHKIKAAITGGKLQITRCDDNACEYLLLELKKNVESQK